MWKLWWKIEEISSTENATTQVTTNCGFYSCSWNYYANPQNNLQQFLLQLNRTYKKLLKIFNNFIACANPSNTHEKNPCGEIKRGWKRSAFSCWNKSDVVVGIIVNHCRNFLQNFFVMNIFDQYFVDFCYIFKTLQKRRFFHLKIALNTAKSHQKLNFSFFGIVFARKIRSSRHRLSHG